MNVFYIFLVVVLLTLLILKYLTRYHDYWKKRNVPYLKPSLIFGNYKDMILLRKHQTIVTHEIALKFPNEPYVGTFFGTAPALVLLDPDLLKLVMTTDFYYFNGREINDFVHKETITKNVFFAGGDNWKIQRQNLTPIFSASKIKGMLPLIIECTKQLEVFMEEETKYTPCIDAKVSLGKFTLDAVTSCAFGINANTLKKEVSSTNPFVFLGKSIFESSKLTGIKLFLRQMWPEMFYGLGLNLFDNRIHAYFKKILTEVIAERTKKKSSRNDFVDLLLTWKEKDVLTGDSITNLKTGEKKSISLKVDDDLLTGQCVAVFGAGYETTSIALSTILFEIAKNPDVQDKVIKEVDEYFTKNNGEIKYECANELPYLTACIDEGLRLYPSLGVLTREVMDDYTLPTGLRLRKGDRIHIPKYHIQRNPKYFPEPDQFRPERFYGEAKKDIKPYTYLPYGEGPRYCIGLRFANMVLYAGLLTVLKCYRLELPADMPRTIPLKPYSLISTAAIPIYIKFISRKA